MLMLTPRHLLDFLDTTSLLGTAETLFANGHYPQAHRELHRLLAADGNSAPGWHLLGRIYFRWQHYPSAVNCFEESLKNEERIAVRLDLAEAYCLLGQSGSAREIYRAMSNLEIDDVQSLLRTARGLFVTGDTGQAIIQARKASVVDNAHADAYFDLSCYLAVVGAPSALVEANGRYAIFLDGENPTYRIGLAHYLRRLGRLFDASSLIRTLNKEQIRRQTCQCCLELLEDLFGILADHRSRLVCQSRLRELAAGESAADMSDKSHCLN